MYCKLTYKFSAEKRQIGDYVLCGMTPFNVGQTASCEVKVPQSKMYEPELLATVVPAADGKGWNIACRTDACSMYVNGERVLIACPLEDGDEIVFYDCHNGVPDKVGKKLMIKLRFDAFDDGDYSSVAGVMYKPKRSLNRSALFAAILGVVAIGFALSAWLKDDNLLRHENFDDVSRYVCQIMTDSVYLVSDTIIDGKKEERVVEAICLENAARGTCFLTDSGLFVTARHCIEPWINDEKWNGTSDVSQMSPALRLATWAETENHYLDKPKYSLRSHCVINFGMQQFEFYSSDFSINKSRDQVLCLGNEEQPIYWRTIVPIASRRDMELGDVVSVKVENIKGTISLATMEDMHRFDEADDRDVVILGYPVNDNNTDNVLNKVDGVCQQIEWNEEKNGIVGCIQMSAAINSGNSGGPIFVRIDGNLKVIGIVSKADTKAQQGTFWAVPATEVYHLQTHGGEIEEDTLIFRR